MKKTILAIVLAASVARAGTEFISGMTYGMILSGEQQTNLVCSCGCPKCHCPKPQEEYEVPVWMAYSVGALTAVLYGAWIVFLVIDLR